MAKANKNTKVLLPDETIIKKIYVIRDQKVMLDFDLSALYEVETRVLNQAVKRNIERFPEDFMFRLSPKEWQELTSQIVISSEKLTDLQNGTGMRSQNVISSQKRRKTTSPPFAFTEHGVTMLASILKSNRAVKMSIAVVRAFIELKKSATQYNKISEQLQTLKDRIGEHDEQLNSIYTAIENLLDDKIEKELKEQKWTDRKRIGFKSAE